MSFQQPSLVDLLALINTTNAIAPPLVPSDITYSAPQVVAGSWREQATLKNTAIRVTASETSQYQGNVTQLYDRLSLASLGLMPGFKLVASNPVTVHDLIPNIKFFTGIDFSTADLENTPITTDGDGVKTAVLSAKTTSMGWVGNLSMVVTAGGVALDSAVTQPVLPGLLYPNTAAVPGTNTFAEVYLYGYDFTAYVSDLLSLAPGVISGANATKLVTMLKAVDVSAGKTLWTTDPSATSWSLDGATVSRNGLNSTTLPTNPAYKYVLGITPKAGLISPVGTMYLHYNDPFNPDEF